MKIVTLGSGMLSPLIAKTTFVWNMELKWQQIFSSKCATLFILEALNACDGGLFVPDSE